MADQTEQDALAEVIDQGVRDHAGIFDLADDELANIADAILASDWLAEHDRRVKAEALREARDELEMHAVGSTCQSCGADNFAPVGYAVDLLMDLARAWDEGRGARLIQEFHGTTGAYRIVRPTNPYRTEAGDDQ